MERFKTYLLKLAFAGLFLSVACGDDEEPPALSAETDILTFTMPEQTGDADIDPSAHTVVIEVMQSADLTELTPSFTLSAGATSIPPSGTTEDYSSVATITVTAEDGTTSQDWTVTVSEEGAPPSDAADILSFSVSEQTSLATINSDDNTVTLQVQNGTDLSSLTPTIVVSPGASSDPASGESDDYNSAVTIRVTAEDETTVEDWTVTVTEQESDGPPSEATDILTFTVPGQAEPEYIDPNNHVVVVITESGTDLKEITPTFTLSPGATSTPMSGTPGDYSDATLIVVTAEDGEEQQIWGVKIFNGFDAAGLCDVSDCADDSDLRSQCESAFNDCIAQYGEEAFLQCAGSALTVCD